MQNKPNLQKSQMNVSIFLQKAYENKSNWTLGENEPNQTQYEPNLPARYAIRNTICPESPSKGQFSIKMRILLVFWTIYRIIHI